MTARLGSLCTGAGLLDVAVGQVLDVEPVWHCENDPHASRVLANHWPDVPNHGDLTAVDWAAVEPVDVVCFGFPCQDLSYAGSGAGITEGTRSGLWHACWDAVRVLRPRLVLVENVAALLVRRPGFDVVAADMAADGYDASWTCLRASDVGAPYERNRLWIAATDALGTGRQGQGSGPSGRAVLARGRAPALADADGQRFAWRPERDGEPLAAIEDAPRRYDAHRLGVSAWGEHWPAVARWERVIGRAAPPPTNDAGRLSPPFVEWIMGASPGWVTGVPGVSRTAQLRILGNGVVPRCAAAAYHDLLADRLDAGAAA